MHLIDNQSLTADERIDLAFRYDVEDTYVKKGMEILNSYALWKFLTVMHAVVLNGYMKRLRLIMLQQIRFIYRALEKIINNEINTLCSTHIIGGKL